MTQSKPEQPMKPLEANVVSRPSHSPLTKVYEAPEFRIEWDNDVAFNVARNIVRLRRFRKMSQTEVAEKMGTSQSAIARIEGAEENITLSTLERLIVALRGRLQISIGPQEMPIVRRRPWWEAYELSTSQKEWTFVGGAYRQIGTTEQVILGFEKDHSKKKHFLISEATT